MMRGLLAPSLLALLLGVPMTVLASETSDPASAIRQLVRANAEKDFSTLSRMMAHDADIISYGVAGRKYVGWSELEQGIKDEFLNAQKLEIPINELKVWTKDNLAWYAMELDYIRYVTEGAELKRTILPMRETGVLEQRDGRWQLLSWHESFRTASLGGALGSPPADSRLRHTSEPQTSRKPDVSGEWEILEVEDDKRYTATLDGNGNGPYSQHNGRFTTTTIADRLWQGTWSQSGNDREGGFEIQLSDDGTAAKGIWWYTRVGRQKNIPPREHGGTYHWKRLTRPAGAQ
ncbi:MAG: nuclear transport factor 2 family protein [Nitrospira sp.]|nr:nuclear transport factor 2 family protein [Nitrospira sp.]MDH4368774.1 nuclear transport factor 2 family protein [Nitrospira sp.]MDH5498077.1 nuclear transport factor 2 family protein [Nitrospira sp.]